MASSGSPSRASIARRRLLSLAGFVVSGVLFWLWLRSYGRDLLDGGAPRWELVLLAVGLLVAEEGIYLFRNAAALQIDIATAWRKILRSMLVSEGAGGIAPSLAGDALEVVLYARALKRPAANVALAMVVRMSMTFSALLAVGAVAAARVSDWAAVVLVLMSLACPIVVCRGGHALFGRLAPRLLGRWGTGPMPEPYPFPSIFRNVFWGWAQLATNAVTLWVLGSAFGEPAPFHVWFMALGVVELARQVPLPLGSLGLHHWTLVGAMVWLAPDAPAPARVAVGYHALSLLVMGGAALWAIQGSAERWRRMRAQGEEA
jgi:hypothetical protein